MNIIASIGTVKSVVYHVDNTGVSFNRGSTVHKVISTGWIACPAVDKYIFLQCIAWSIYVTYILLLGTGGAVWAYFWSSCVLLWCFVGSSCEL